MRRLPPGCDTLWMQHAMRLAYERRGHVWPNPAVGCVIVKDGFVVSEGATHAGGRPHAERVALDRAGANAAGATLYVTLEPCCHWGKTPPCVEAIASAGVVRVVCAIRDPDPRVNGGGIRFLRAAGIAVTIGFCATEAERLMSGFFTRIRTGKPELIVLDQDLDLIPRGIDARIVSWRGSLRLLTGQNGSRAAIDTAGMPPNSLLAQLGDLGLTSVAIARSDLHRLGIQI